MTEPIPVEGVQTPGQRFEVGHQIVFAEDPNSFIAEVSRG